MPGELLVKYNKDSPITDIKDFYKSQGATLLKEYPEIGYHLIRVYEPKVEGTIRTVEALSNSSLFETAEPNYELKTLETPNDPRFSELWGMHNTGQTGGTSDADIDAPDAWDIFTGSNDVIVAVIDTGVDYTHEDLADNMWTNPGEIAGNGIDDDGNGFIDDYYGWDFAYDDNDPMDVYSHGTHCSGTVGGVGDNGKGVTGVCWNVEIMAVKFLSDGGSGSTSDAIDAINYATMMGADVMSNSWGGGGYSSALEAAIQAADDAGILFIAAAGNDGLNNDVYPHYPSSYDVPNVMSIAATDHNDDLIYFSNYGNQTVDLGAPGVNILSSVPGNSYTSHSGTSMATPHVAGAAALLKAFNPSLSHLEIRDILMETVDLTPDLSGKTVTGGRLNIHTAITSSSPLWLNVTLPNGTVNPGNQTNVTVTINATGLSNGTHNAYISIWSNDLRNNPVVVSLNLDVIDITPPVLEVTSPVNATTYNLSSVSLNFTATDPSKIDWIGYNLDGSGNVTLSSGANKKVVEVNTALTNLTDGWHNITIYTNDTVGHMAFSDLIWFYVCAPDIDVWPSQINKTLYPGDIASENITIRNDGCGMLEFEMDGKIRTYQLQDYELQLPGGTKSKGNNYASLAPFKNPATPTQLEIKSIKTLSEPIDVLIVAADSSNVLRSLLLEFDDISTVDQFDTRYGTPTLLQLQQYDVVIVWTNWPHADPDGLGDVLADYVDFGGKVILSVASVTTPWNLGGRIYTDGYLPFAYEDDLILQHAEMDWYDSSHQIMEGVNTITDEIQENVTLTEGAKLVALWDNGEPLVATKDSVVSINLFLSDSYLWTGDVPTLVHNILTWSDGGYWLYVTPQNGTVNPGSQINVTLKMNTTDLLAGIYNRDVYIQSNDLENNPFVVPINLTVIDITPPDTIITLGPNGTIAKTDVTFTWSGSDDATSSSQLVYSYQLDGYWSDWTLDKSKSYNDLSNGDYKFKVKAKDLTGNEDLSPAETSFKVSVLSPQPSQPSQLNFDGLGGGGGGSEGGEALQSDEIKTDSNGKVLSTYTKESSDKKAKLIILEGVFALGSDEKPLKSVTITPISLGGTLAAFNLAPDGATFDPPIELIIKYDPEDIQGKDLVIKTYKDGKWTELETTIDPDKNTATAKISHFSVFALFAQNKATTTTTPTIMPTPSPEQLPIVPPAEEQSPAVPWFPIFIVLISVALIIVILYIRRSRANP